MKADTIYLPSYNTPEGYGVFDWEQDTEENPRRINLEKIDNIEFSGIDTKDAPDFCDAFIESADMNGIEMSEEELDDLNENHPEFVHEKLIEFLY